MNGTSFLLDKSMDTLERIHEMEAVMMKDKEWKKLSQEQTSRQR